MLSSLHLPPCVSHVWPELRSRAKEHPRLLAVGNPLPSTEPLEGAQFEVEIVASTFPAVNVDVLVGKAATKQAVIAGLRGATYVHLACHGFTDPREEVLSATLSFANDEPLSAHELIDIAEFEPRLVVASACQTGVIQEYEAADVALGLSTAFLAAGAAGVVATLWPVDDYSTALLMSRFYESLIETGSRPGHPHGGDPAAALRAAQLWLRALTPEDEETYLDRHPQLKARRSARQARPGRYSYRSPDAPYSIRSHWAAFVFTGA